MDVRSSFEAMVIFQNTLRQIKELRLNTAMRASDILLLFPMWRQVNSLLSRGEK